MAGFSSAALAETFAQPNGARVEDLETASNMGGSTGRNHLFELHEFSWFPKAWRNLFTDSLSYFTITEEIYAPISDLLKPLIEKRRDFKIVDLCSGSGSPIAKVLESINDHNGIKVRAILTDKFPNISAFKQISEVSNGKIGFVDNSVDAKDVPENFDGFRTFFSSFHHFKEESALAILSDAVKKSMGIGIFEFTERDLLLRLFPYHIFRLIWFLLCLPFVRPFRWQIILWTYLIPVIPVTFLFDGFISCFRTYSEKELQRFVNRFQDCGFTWKIGRIKTSPPFYVTYLIAYPSEII